MNLLTRWCLVGFLLGLGWLFPAQAQPVVKYVHTDALGSVVMVTDANRNVLERREYEPYGAQLAPAVQGGPGYTGHVQDAPTGLVYMQQRYYDPEWGLFLSVDPVAANRNTGALFNRYKYAANNPFSFYDPDGRCTGSRITNSDSTCRSTGGWTTQRHTLSNPQMNFFAEGRQSSVAPTVANQGTRLAGASAEVSRLKKSVEGLSHPSLDDAALHFEKSFQWVSERYAVEIFADINPLSGNRLEKVFVSNQFDKEGVGNGASSAYSGLPTIHSHPIIGGSAEGFAPFGPSDMSWMRSTGDGRHYVSDPTGVYRYNGLSESPARIGP